MSEDPFKAREIEKYGRPIPSREFILEVLATYELPLQMEEIAEALALKAPIDTQALQKRLRAMERDGELIFTRQRRYVIPSRLKIVKGEVVGHRDGFGFLKVEDQEKDYFLHFHQMKQCLDGDSVLAQLLPLDKRGRAEARIVRILKPRDPVLIGRYQKDEKIGTVVPTNTRLPYEFFIPVESSLGAQDGQIVTVELVQRPTQSHQGTAKIINILGRLEDPGLEVLMAIHDYALPASWPEPLLAALERLPDSVDASAYPHRVDLRALPFVTIDGETAKDFDDAVYCAPHTSEGWTLWVAIADVSHYVPYGSDLDEAAKVRGNSVYFPTQALPMLPEKLSNHLCSLVADQDRLSFVCQLSLCPQGQLLRYEFQEAIIRSHARLTYQQVSEALAHSNPIMIRSGKNVLPELQRLHQLYRLLAAQREALGTLSFEREEAEFQFDGSGRIESIGISLRNDAHKLIESCMILANIAAATFISEKKLAGPYRVHEKPTAEKLTEFRTFLKEFGVPFKKVHPTTAADYAEVLKAIAEHPQATLLQALFLRAMKPARYSPKNLGHFGLSLQNYAHFTSPIRRYPDLILHRLIKGALQACPGGPGSTKQKPLYTNATLRPLTEHCSRTERRADEASRDVIDALKCHYMQDHIGKTVSGLISSIVSFGFFVRLDDIFIDGLVHVSALPNDYYDVDLTTQRIQAKTRQLCYRIGDKVTVQVASVSLGERKIELLLLEPLAAPAGKGMAQIHAIPPSKGPPPKRRKRKRA